MAKYRVKKAQSSDFRDRNPEVGFEFEWDGVTVDGEGDIVIPMSDGGTAWLLPESAELITPTDRVTKGTRTVQEEVYTLTLSRVEALSLRDLFDGTVGWDDLNDLFNDLEGVL